MLFINPERVAPTIDFLVAQDATALRLDHSIRATPGLPKRNPGLWVVTASRYINKLSDTKLYVRL